MDTRAELHIAMGRSSSGGAGAPGEGGRGFWPGMLATSFDQVHWHEASPISCTGRIRDVVGFGRHVQSKKVVDSWICILGPALEQGADLFHLKVDTCQALSSERTHDGCIPVGKTIVALQVGSLHKAVILGCCVFTAPSISPAGEETRTHLESLSSYKIPLNPI